MKPRAGVSPRADGEMLAALRRQLGPDIGLMVDINHAYSARAAIASAQRMEPSDLLWIEEPVEPEDIPGYAAVAAAVSTAVAGGEALGSLAAFRDFLVANTLSILQPDLTVCGATPGSCGSAALAAAFDLPIMPHVFGTIVNHQAALQVAALLSTRRGAGPAAYPYVEVDISTNPLLALQGTVAPNGDGTLDIPDLPGTGLDLDADRLEPLATRKLVVPLSQRNKIRRKPMDHTRRCLTFGLAASLLPIWSGGAKAQADCRPAP